MLEKRNGMTYESYDLWESLIKFKAAKSKQAAGKK